MTSPSSRGGSPMPSSHSANPKGQADASSGTQTDITHIEPFDSSSSFISSSAPSPSPALPNPPLPSTLTIMHLIIHPRLEPTPCIYSPRPSPLDPLASSPSSADETRSNSPIGVGPTRPASPVRLVAECEPMPLVWEMPCSPVLAHVVPVPVPVLEGKRVDVPGLNPDVEVEEEAEVDAEADAESATGKSGSSETGMIRTTAIPVTTSTSMATATDRATVTATVTSTITTSPHPTTETTATETIPTEQQDSAQAAPAPVTFPLPPLPPLPPQTQINTYLYLIDHRTSNPNPIPSNTNIRSLPNYGPFPPYGHGLFFPNSDLHSYTVTEGDGYWPLWGQRTWLIGLGAGEEGVVSVRVGRWVYRYLSRPLAVGLDPDVRSREAEADGGTGTETERVMEGEGVEGGRVEGEGVEEVEREDNSHRLLGPSGRGWIWGRSSHKRS